MGRWAESRDANEAEIIKALESVGATVTHLSAGRGGIPDLLVGFRGVNYLLEVKTAKGKLRPVQVEWHALWGGQVSVVRTVEDAWEAIGVEVTV